MDESDSHTSYRNLLTKLPDGPEVIEGAYQAVEKKVQEVEKYVEVWLRYQSLWDMETSLIYNKLENNLERWTILLRNIRYVTLHGVAVAQDR
jgi:dynein heavy chain 1